MDCASTCQTETAMFSKDFLAASLSKEELTKRLNAVLEETKSWTRRKDTYKLKFIAKDIAEHASQLLKSASPVAPDVLLLVACIAADILYIFAPKAFYDCNQLRSIFALFLSSMDQLLSPVEFPNAFLLLKRLVSVRAFALAAAEEISSNMLNVLLATISSVCKRGVGTIAQPLLADCIVNFADGCSERYMSTLRLDTFFETISTCKNFDANTTARVFASSLRDSPELQDAAAQYLLHLKQTGVTDNVFNLVAVIAPIAPRALRIVMPALAVDSVDSVDSNDLQLPKKQRVQASASAAPKFQSKLDAWSRLVIPDNPYTSTAVKWMKENHPAVLACEGFGVAKRAQCVTKSGSNLVVDALGSFGVDNVATCVTTRNLLAWTQSAANSADYDAPGLLYSDILPMFSKIASDFEAAGGSKFYTIKASKRTAGYADVMQSAIAYRKMTTAALEEVGLRVMPLTLSPDIMSCYSGIGRADAVGRCLPAHPGGTRGSQLLTAGCIGECQLMFADLAVADGKFTTQALALEAFSMKHAQNKLDVIAMLNELAIDLSTVPRRSFLHLPLPLAQQVWQNLFKAFGMDAARGMFIHTIWVWADLEECDHGVPACVCTTGCARGFICHHGKERRMCVKCGGAGICQHGKDKYVCKECGGKGICKHGKRRNRCKECGGKSLCVHGKEKHLCKECGGKGICEHGKQKHFCTQCGGNGICKHGKRRHRCKECKGGAAK